MGRQPGDGRGRRQADVPGVSEDVLERTAREALDAAGIQGLCREGRIEAAVGAVRALRPDWSAADSFALVCRIAAENDARTRRRP